MAKFKNIGGGERRAFAITIGLAEGYGPQAKIHKMEEVVQLVLAHLKARAASGQDYLTGMVTEGQVVYAWPEGPGKAGGGHEPAVVYSGEVSPLYNAGLTDEQVAGLLNDLASELGSALGQTRVYLTYRSSVWVLQAEDQETPTGD